MQRLPLSDPRLAAALMAVGVEHRMFHVEPLHNTKTGQKISSWYLESNDIADIRELLAEADPGHQKTLAKTTPNHPFIAALAGVENYCALERWLKKPNMEVQCSPAAPGSQILRLTLDNFASPFLHAPPEVGLASIAHAAAMVAAGFPIYHTIQASGAFGFPAVSVTMPPLTAHQCLDAANAMSSPRNLTMPDLPGYPAGQHPFCYALAACLNLRLLGPSEAAAWKAPTHFFPGRGTRSALATDAALRRRGFEDQLRQHINGF